MRFRRPPKTTVRNIIIIIIMFYVRVVGPSVCPSFGSHALVLDATTVAAATGYRVWSSAGRAE